VAKAEFEVMLRLSIIPPAGQLHLVPEFDLSADYESLVMNSCELLSESGCRFHAEGFGQSHWPVDVSYDLSSVMEQLPSAIAALKCGERTTIDFYGQGVERSLTFVPAGDGVAIHCSSRTDWEPIPCREWASQRDVLALFADLANDFKSALSRTCPSVAQIRPFKD
jgi:hypothetical protein